MKENNFSILKKHFDWKVLIRLTLAGIWCYAIYLETGIFTACFAFLVAISFELESIKDKIRLSTTELHNDIFLKILGLTKGDLR